MKEKRPWCLNPREGGEGGKEGPLRDKVLSPIICKGKREGTCLALFDSELREGRRSTRKEYSTREGFLCSLYLGEKVELSSRLGEGEKNGGGSGLQTVRNLTKSTGRVFFLGKEGSRSCSAVLIVPPLIPGEEKKPCKRNSAERGRWGNHSFYLIGEGVCRLYISIRKKGVR